MKRLLLPVYHVYRLTSKKRFSGDNVGNKHRTYIREFNSIAQQVSTICPGNVNITGAALSENGITYITCPKRALSQQTREMPYLSSDSPNCSPRLICFLSRD